MLIMFSETYQATLSAECWWSDYKSSDLNISDRGLTGLDGLTDWTLILIVMMVTIKICYGQFRLMNQHDNNKLGKPHKLIITSSTEGKHL